MRKAFLSILIIGFFLYLPSLFGPFLWDDEDFVYANRYVKNFQLDKFFTSPITEGRDKGSNYFRPIQGIAYSSTHAIFGFNPFWFHLLNVLAHISAACAVYYFFKKLISKQVDDTKSNPLNASVNGQNVKSSVAAHEHFKVTRWQDPQLISLLISLLFLVHPIQTEAVSYISGLSDPLFVLFGFLSLIFFILKDERKNMIPLSLFFFLLSLLSKETGLVFLPLLVLVHALQNWTSGNLVFWKSGFLKALQTFIKETWSYFVIAGVYLWYHFTKLTAFDIGSAWGNNPYANSIGVRLLTFVQNLFLYVQLLIFPDALFMERDYSIPIQTDIFNPYLIIFLIINALIIFGLWKLKNYLEIGAWKLKIIFFCYTAFFVSFIPYTGIVLINGIFYEHFLYLPMVFFFAFFIILMPKNKLLGYSFIVLLILFSARNVVRQLEWNDSVRFYSQTLSHAPKSIRIINGLGMAQAEKGDISGAIKTYSKGIRLNPKVPNLYHNLANAQAANEDIQNAEKNFLKSLEVDPTFLFSAQSLAVLYQKTGQKEKLEKLTQQYSRK